MAEFNERLQLAMKERGVKQTDIANETGISKSMISEYYHGRYQPKSDNLYKIAEVLNVNEVWLMGYDGVSMDREARNEKLKPESIRSTEFYSKKINEYSKDIVVQQLRDENYTPYYSHIINNMAYLNYKGIEKVNEYINIIKKVDEFSSDNEDNNLPTIIIYDEEGNEIRKPRLESILAFYERHRTLTDDELEEAYRVFEQYTLEMIEKKEK